MSQDKRLAILGVGLLGGSLGMAAKALSAGWEVVGYGHRRSTLDRALEVGAIDEAQTEIGAAVRGASIVVVCTPVGLFEEVFRGMSGALAAGAVVTDVGSTKASAVELARRYLPGASFVGSHPMAGSEKRGVEFARPDLFAGALCITTPGPTTPAADVDRVEDFWRSIGMQIVRLDPQQHDRLLADVSHLPHALAAALVAMQADEGLALAGKGFLDTTRIAGGDGALWRDILRDNRENVKASLGRLREQLAKLEGLLDEPGDGEKLVAWLDEAAKRREAWLHKKLREFNPD